MPGPRNGPIAEDWASNIGKISAASDVAATPRIKARNEKITRDGRIIADISPERCVGSETPGCCLRERTGL